MNTDVIIYKGGILRLVYLTNIWYSWIWCSVGIRYSPPSVVDLPIIRVFVDIRQIQQSWYPALRINFT